MPVERADEGRLVGFAEQAVGAGTIVCTDSATPYSTPSRRYENQAVVRSVAGYVCGLVHINGITSALWALQRELYGTSHDFSPKHHDQYVHEEAIRLNEGSWQVDRLDRTVFWTHQIGRNRNGCEALIAGNGLYARES